MSQSFLIDATPGERVDYNWIPLGGSVFRQMRGAQRKLSPAFTVFQVPTAQNNQYTEAAYFGAARSAILQYFSTSSQQSLFEGCPRGE